MSRELVKVKDGALLDVDSIDAQFQLLAMFNLPPTMAKTHKVERRGDTWTLCKRENPVEIFADDDGRMRAVAQVQRPAANKSAYQERAANTTTRRGFTMRTAQV